MADEEDNILESVDKIKSAVEKTLKIEGYVPPPKPDLSEFNGFDQKIGEAKSISDKFVENPRVIMKEVDRMKQLLNNQQR